MRDDYTPQLVIEAAHVCPADNLKKGKALFVSRDTFPFREWATEIGTQVSMGKRTKDSLACRVCGQVPSKAKGFSITSRFYLTHLLPAPDYIERMPITREEFKAWPKNQRLLIDKMQGVA